MYIFVGLRIHHAGDDLIFRHCCPVSSPNSSLSPLYSEQRRKRATPRRTPLPAGIPPVFFLSDGRPAVGEGERPRDHRPAVDRLDIYLSRPRCCSSLSGKGARVCRRPQFVHSFCNGLEGMEFEPLRLVFLLLMSESPLRQGGFCFSGDFLVRFLA